MNTPSTLEQRIRRLEDIEEIKQLKAAYCNLLDGGWPEKGPTHMGSIGDIFVDDGVWDGRPYAPRAEGRNAIVRMMTDYRVVPFILHYVMNPVITVDGDRANGHWHVIATPKQPNGTAYWIFGTYDEDYVRTPEGWRYKLIRFTAAAAAPYEVGWAAMQFADPPTY